MVVVVVVVAVVAVVAMVAVVVVVAAVVVVVASRLTFFTVDEIIARIKSSELGTLSNFSHDILLKTYKLRQ